MKKQMAEPWLSFFEEIDSMLSESIEIHCFGGFAVTAYYGMNRETSDVDFVVVNPNNVTNELLSLGQQGSPLHKKHKLYLQKVGISIVPDDYESRLKEMFPGDFKKIKLLMLDPYDIALSKIERNDQRDRDDVKYLAREALFDLEVLRSRYEKEVRPYLGNPSREDLTLKLWIEMVEEERQSAN